MSRNEAYWFISDATANDTVVSAAISLYEKWYDCESDLKLLVDWLHTQAIVRDVTGEVRVSGEEADDLWEMLIRDGSVLKLMGHVSYEGDEDAESAEDVVREIVAALIGTDSLHHSKILIDMQARFADRVRRAR